MSLYSTVMAARPLLAQAAPDVEELAQRIELLNVGNLLSAATIIAVAYAANRVLSATLESLGEGQARRRLFFKKVQSFTRLGIFAAAAYLVVATFLDFEEDRAALLGLGGTLAVAVGFALKDTASSLMAGILILVDQPFQVGDRVAFGDTYGEVVEIGLRSVRIVTLDDNQVSIPNNKFLTEAVSSSNAGALDMMVEIDFYIAQSADFELAKQIVYEATITSRYVFLSKPVVVQVYDEITPLAFATHVKSKAYVIDTRYEKALLCDVMERVKRAFRLHGIHPPYTRAYEVQAEGWEEFSTSPNRVNAPVRSQIKVGRAPQGVEVEEVGAQTPEVSEV